jgi:serine/threonine-protein kinase
MWVIIIALLAASCASVEAASPPAGEIDDPPPTVAEPVTPTPIRPMTATPWPPITETPYPMITRTPRLTSGDLPERITDEHGVILVLIPEGEFIMGSEEGFPDEVPVHTVWVDAFYIDLTEVTNRQYQDCVEAGVCQPPRRTDCCTEDPSRALIWPEYFGNPEFDAYPVIFINWYDAYTFCDWRGARLATEAEWEKASRGTDGRTYPWGNEEPIPGYLNFTWPEREFEQRPLYSTAPVGSYPLGASPYGVLDLAGNVYEWLWDVYAPDYFEYSPYRNPTGPEEGVYRLTRGGSFYNQAFRNRSANRNNAYIPATSVHFDGGARCARDIPGRDLGLRLP